MNAFQEQFSMIDIALFHKPSGTLIFSDLHLGYEASLERDGIMVPRLQFPQLQDRMQRIATLVRPQHIIINGDMKHDFGTIDDEEWRHTLQIIDMLREHAPLTIIEGNHDKIIAPILKKRDLEPKTSVIIDDVFICHGDSIPPIPKQIAFIVIGHEHCAIGINDGHRLEKYKCFAVGTFRECTLIGMPSTNPLTIGTDLAHEKRLSPFLQDIDEFTIYIVSDDGNTLPFGTIKKIRDM